jgi:hypothetical protein
MDKSQFRVINFYKKSAKLLVPQPTASNFSSLGQDTLTSALACTVGNVLVSDLMNTLT